MLQVGGAVFIGRSANGDDLQLAEGHRFRDIRGESQLPAFDICLDKVFEARFLYGDMLVFQPIDFAGNDIHAQNMMPDLCKAGPCNQADITGTGDCYLHK
jgi:hypothetical protein